MSVTTPTVAIEIASRRITIAELTSGAGKPAIGAYATEPLPADAVTPALVGTNIANPGLVAAALTRACAKAGIGSLRRAALVVPDAVARVSILHFEQIPSKAADFDQLVRWQLRKSTPFPLEEAKVEHFRASAQGAGAMWATVVARTDVLAQYEAVATIAGARAGIVDLASFNIMNAVMACGDPAESKDSAPAGPGADWLLVCLAHEGTSIAILRGADLLFYRNRASMDGEPLSALIHQTAMYHEDRLSGATFKRVLLCGAALTSGNTDAVRAEIASHLGMSAELVDVRQAADLRDRITTTPDTLDALAAGVGVLVRDRAA